MEPAYHFHLIINNPRCNEGSTNPTNEANLLDYAWTNKEILVRSAEEKETNDRNEHRRSAYSNLVPSMPVLHTVSFHHPSRESSHRSSFRILCHIRMKREGERIEREGNREEHEEQAREPIRLSALSPAFNQRLC